MSAKAWREGSRTDETELTGPYGNVSSADPLFASDLDSVVTAYRVETSRSSDETSRSSDRLAEVDDLNDAWQIDTQAGALRAHVESQRSPRGQVTRRKKMPSRLWMLAMKPVASGH
jgi:hypothetical protein